MSGAPSKAFQLILNKQGNIDAVNGPPWLVYSNLRSDGSVEGNTEAKAYAKFIRPTAAECSMWGSIRRLFQGLALVVDKEATVKIIGSCALGTAAYNSGVDLLVETPMPNTLVDDFESVLKASNIPASRRTTIIGDQLRIDGKSLAVLNPLWNNSDIFITLSFSSPLLNASERQKNKFIKARLAELPGADEIVMVIKQLLKQMKLVDDQTGLSSHSVTIMILAFLHCFWKGQDLSWVLREFFAFYVSFDFNAHSIALPSPQNPNVTGKELFAQLFPPKVHNEPVSVIDYDGSNSSRNTTRLMQIIAMMQYVNLSITKWETSASLARGKSLFFNIIAHKDTWDRYLSLEGITIDELRAHHANKHAAPAPAPTPVATPAPAPATPVK
eukprot:Sspe_Gene.52062::Locus_28860_Transcript_1_1_Confidence_1.000_Length_1212::g.52062::m.52062/K03514/PAPD5_7, TRF4; non-canonical poly(A) RNA polymerase PAPD5/7